MVTTGVGSGVATTSDDAVTLFEFPHDGIWMLMIQNEGSVAGWWSCDGGESWSRLRQSSAIGPTMVKGSSSLQIKRTPSGSNMSGVHASAWAV